MSERGSYSGKAVLVTGADGFIGSHLAEALAGEGAQVTALALYDAFGRNGWLDELSDEVLESVRIVRGDVRDAAFVVRLIAGQDVVFHLAALITIPHSYAAAQSYVDVNLGGTLNVLEAARAGGTGRVVHTSTSEVYGTARFTPITEDHPLQGQSPYSASKIAADMMAEAYARSFELPAMVLRPFNTFGPRQSERGVIPTAIRQALDPACPAIRLGDLTPVRDFCYVSDIVRAFLGMGLADGLERGRPYNCGTGKSVSVGEIVSLIQGITGSNKPVEREEARFRPEDSEVRTLLADPGRLAAAIGWAPQVGIEEGLALTVDWWRARIREGAVRRQSGYLT